LPNRKTPYDVWFGRTRRWIYEPPLDNDETEVEESEDQQKHRVEGADSEQRIIEIEDDNENAAAGGTQSTQEHTELNDILFFANKENAGDEHAAEENTAAEEAAAMQAESAVAAETLHSRSTLWTRGQRRIQLQRMQTRTVKLRLKLTSRR
jgi:hypothetical protein